MLEGSGAVAPNGTTIDSLTLDFDEREIQASQCDYQDSTLHVQMMLLIFMMDCRPVQTSNQLVQWPAALHMLTLIFEDQM